MYQNCEHIWRQRTSKNLPIWLIFNFHQTFALKNNSHHDKAEILSFLAILLMHWYLTDDPFHRTFTLYYWNFCIWRISRGFFSRSQEPPCSTSWERLSGNTFPILRRTSERSSLSSSVADAIEFFESSGHPTFQGVGPTIQLSASLIGFSIC